MKPVANAHDVAAYILKKKKSITAMKLQKLLYYSQAWSLVWDDRPLFGEKIQAWANGPVVPAIYAKHRGKYEITSWDAGDASKLDAEARATVNSVLEHYGGKTGMELSDLTHRARPWEEARVGLSPNDRGSNEISLASMEEYYSEIYRNGQKKRAERKAESGKAKAK